MGSTSEAELATAHSRNTSCRLGRNRDQDILPINQATMSNLTIFSNAATQHVIMKQLIFLLATASERFTDQLIIL